jgi:large subunit ribosomal protein L17
MKHLKSGKRLSRPTGHRNMLLRNLSISLLDKGKIVTTEAKAKELRRHIEKIITIAKVDNFNTRRKVARFIHDEKTLKALFTEIAPRYSDRPGGYTRIIHKGFRAGDGAELVVVELVE